MTNLKIWQIWDFRPQERHNKPIDMKFGKEAYTMGLR